MKNSEISQEQFKDFKSESKDHMNGFKNEIKDQVKNSEISQEKNMNGFKNEIKEHHFKVF